MCDISKRNLRQYLNIVPAASIFFTIGAGIGWAAPALIYLTSDKNEYPITESDLSWIASTQFGVEITSPIVAGYCSSKTGRKPILIAAGMLMVLSWITNLVSKSAAMIILSRALLGTAAGFNDITWSIYLGEFATPDKRGILGSAMIISFAGGIMFEFLLGTIVSYESLAIIPLAIATFGLFTSFFIVESPYLLLMKDKESEALNTLIWLRGSCNDDVRKEFTEIKHYIHTEKHTDRSFRHFFRAPSEYTIFIMGVFGFGFMMFSGYMTITVYQGLIMEEFKDIPSGYELVFIFGLVTFISTNISPFFIDLAGRRIMMLFGFSCSAVVQFLIAFLFFVHKYEPFKIPYAPQSIIVLFNIQGVLLCSCILPTACVIKSELFPQEIKLSGSVASTVVNATVQFVTLSVFIPIWNTFGVYLNFLMYSVFCVFISVCVYALLPETKGKTLAQIQKKAPPDQKKTLREVMTTLI